MCTYMCILLFGKISIPLIIPLQQLQKVQREASGDHSSLPSVMPTFSDNEDTDSATPSRKSLIAEEQRSVVLIDLTI